MPLGMPGGESGQSHLSRRFRFDPGSCSTGRVARGRSRLFHSRQPMPKSPLICPVCGSRNKTSTVPGDAWQVLVCDLCGHCRLEPTLDDLPWEQQQPAGQHLEIVRGLIASGGQVGPDGISVGAQMP